MVKFKFNKSTAATRLLLSLMTGYGPDDVDPLEDFFNQFDKLEEEPEEEEELSPEGEPVTTDLLEEEEAGLEETSPKPADTSASEGGKEPEGQQPVTPATPAPAAKAEEPATPPAAAVVPAKTPEQEKAEYDKIVGDLQKAYAISDDDAEAIMSDPGTVIPKLMTNMHIKIMSTAANMMQSMLPQLVEQAISRNNATESLEKKFTSRWPDLNKKTDLQAVYQAVQTVRALNPTIAVDDLIEEVGPIAYALLKRQAPAAAPAQQQVPAVKPKSKPAVPAKAAPSKPRESSSDPMQNFLNSLME